MSNLPSDPKKFSRLRWIQQITENHCGPAVLQMLLENIGVNASQQEITEAAGATHTIETLGTRVDQLAKVFVGSHHVGLEPFSLGTSNQRANDIVGFKVIRLINRDSHRYGDPSTEIELRDQAWGRFRAVGLVLFEHLRAERRAGFKCGRHVNGFSLLDDAQQCSGVSKNRVGRRTPGGDDAFRQAVKCTENVVHGVNDEDGGFCHFFIGVGLPLLSTAT